MVELAGVVPEAPDGAEHLKALPIEDANFLIAARDVQEPLLLSGENAIVTTVPVGVRTSRATKASFTNVPSGLNTWMRLFDRSAT